MINKLRLGPRGQALILEFEQYREHAYPDQGGVWTVGYGTTRIDGRPVMPGMSVSYARALELFALDAADAVDAVNRLVTVVINQHQFDALVSFTYNLGAGALQQSSLLRMINSRAPVFADLFLRWNKVRNPHTGKLEVSNGITRRRQREYDLYALSVDLPGTARA